MQQWRNKLGFNLGGCGGGVYHKGNMGRDLLYRPQVVVLPEDEEEDGKAVKKKTGSSAAQKSELNKDLRARDLGRVGGEELLKKFQQAQKKPAAFKNAYFNKDTSSVRDTNFGTREARAMRGADQASDLRNVVIPGPMGKESPDPGELRSAGERMGLLGEFDLSMESLLGKQGEWTQGEGMTHERLLARLEELEEMVVARVHALSRMGAGASDREVSNATVLQAAIAQGEAMDKSEDISEEGRVLAENITEEAAGMHTRIRKTLGLPK